MLLSLFVASIPLAIHVYFVASAEQETITDLIKLNAISTTRTFASKENRAIDTSRQFLDVLARSPFVYEGGIKCDEFLSSTLKANPEYTTLIVADTKGDIFCNATPFTAPINIADRIYFQQTIKTKAFNVGEYVVERTSNQSSLAVSYPVFEKNGEVKSVVVAGLSFSWFQKMIEEGGVSEGVIINLVDRTSILLARYPHIESAAGKIMFYDPILQNVITQQEGVVKAIDLGGISRIYAFTPLRQDFLKKRESVFFVWGIPTEIALAKIKQDTINHAIILVVSVMAMFSIMWFAGKILFHKFVIR